MVLGGSYWPSYKWKSGTDVEFFLSQGDYSVNCTALISVPCHCYRLL